MAGIYFHIPWCRKVCIYCDFHFSVSIRNKPDMLTSMLKEMEMQAGYLGNEIVSTLYFGGGTPSVLCSDDIKILIDKAYSLFNVTDDPEITLEANPEDLVPEYLSDIADTGINRLSIGVQSFFDEDLEWMNRRHNAVTSLDCINNSYKAGFKNINIDLIYGLPGMDNLRWDKNLDIFFQTKATHLSAYCLTLEKRTIYYHRVKRGLLQINDENRAAEQFGLLMDKASKAGFVHYEISNFCLPGYYSSHNTGYWKQEPYLGIGPSAHSYNGKTRQWNIRNNSLYISNIKSGFKYFEREELDEKTRFNEYILTSLRTMWGVDMVHVKSVFGRYYADHLNESSEKMINRTMLEKKKNRLVLSRKGKYIADSLISELFVTGD